MKESFENQTMRLTAVGSNIGVTSLVICEIYKEASLLGISILTNNLKILGTFLTCQQRHSESFENQTMRPTAALPDNETHSSNIGVTSLVFL